MMRVWVAFIACWCTVLCGQTTHDQELAAIREYAVNYGKGLPDYTCTRVTERKESAIALTFTEPERYGTPQPKGTASTIVTEEELTVSGQRENYKILKVDGQSFGREMRLRPDQVIETITAGQFTSVLQRIFSPEEGARVQWVRLEKLRGRQVNVFSFEVPRAHGERVYDRGLGRDAVVRYSGRVYADAESNAVLRVETHSSDFPSGSEFVGIDLVMDYKPAKIGGREYVMPQRFDLQWHRHLPNAMRKTGRLAEDSSVQAEYKNYRGFSAESGVKFPESEEIRSTITFGGIAGEK